MVDRAKEMPGLSSQTPPADILESASSRAEAEYDGEFAPVSNKIFSTGIGQEETHEAIETLRREIAEDILASGTTFSSPFEVPPGAVQVGDDDTNGRYLKVPLVYCDQTASNRTVGSIEDYVQEKCLPFYGNTHTNTSITGAQSTAFVSEARQIVAEETNGRITGKASLDVVLFA